MSISGTANKRCVVRMAFTPKGLGKIAPAGLALLELRAALAGKGKEGAKPPLKVWPLKRLQR